MTDQIRRMTDRARHIVDLAATEAANCGRIAPSTIDAVIAIIRESQGIAALVLYEYEIDADAMRRAANRVCVDRDPSISEVIERSVAEAEWFGYRLTYAGTEHLLLAICCLHNSWAWSAFRELKVSPIDMCQEVLSILGRHGDWETWLRDHRSDVATVLDCKGHGEVF